jgi:hypothetical protein
MIISEEEKQITALHEAGHALMAALIPEADPIHKVTIIPRGLALGITQQLPLEDRYTYGKDYLEARLSVLMAGRVAEVLINGKTTTGASNDFEQATDIARRMVCEWGMSDLGPLTFGERNDLIFLGRDLTTHKNFSERTSELIDEEVKRIVTRNYQRAQRLLEENKDKLQRIAAALLEKESLDHEEIHELVNGKKTPEFEKPVPAAEAEVPVIQAQAQSSPQLSPQAQAQSASQSADAKSAQMYAGSGTQQTPAKTHAAEAKAEASGAASSTASGSDVKSQQAHVQQAQQPTHAQARKPQPKLPFQQETPRTEDESNKTKE